MRNFKKFSLLIGILCFLQSCEKPTPNTYEKETEDAVKYYISIADLLVETQNNGASASLLFGWLAGIGVQRQIEFITDSLESEIVDIYNKEAEWTYRDAIAYITKWCDSEEELRYSKLAIKLLELYDATSVSLTEYEMVKSGSKKKTWRFKEMNTDITFTFELEDRDTDHMTFTISPLVKSYQKYIESQI